MLDTISFQHRIVGARNTPNSGGFCGKLIPAPSVCGKPREVVFRPESFEQVDLALEALCRYINAKRIQTSFQVAYIAPKPSRPQFPRNYPCAFSSFHEKAELLLFRHPLKFSN